MIAPFTVLLQIVHTLILTTTITSELDEIDLYKVSQRGKGRAQTAFVATKGQKLDLYRRVPHCNRWTPFFRDNVLHSTTIRVLG